MANRPLDFIKTGLIKWSEVEKRILGVIPVCHYCKQSTVHGKFDDWTFISSFSIFFLLFGCFFFIHHSFANSFIHAWFTVSIHRNHSVLANYVTVLALFVFAGKLWQLLHYWFISWLLSYCFGYEMSINTNTLWYIITSSVQMSCFVGLPWHVWNRHILQISHEKLELANVQLSWVFAE